MGRKALPPPLALGDSVHPSDGSLPSETVPNSCARRPPADAASPRSPRSPFRFGQNASEGIADTLQLADVLHQSGQPMELQEQKQLQRPDDTRESPPLSPRRRPVDQQQPLGHRHPRHGDDKASKSGFFFNFGKAATKLSDHAATHQQSNSRGETASQDSDHPTLSKQSTKRLDPPHQEAPVQKPNSPVPSRSEISLASSVDYDSQGNLSSSSKKCKPKPFHLLGRSRSIKDKDSKDSLSPKEQLPAPAPIKAAEHEKPNSLAPLRTAPLQAHDRSFREKMSSAVRNHSAERSQSRDIGGRGRDHESQQHKPLSSSSTPTSGAAFFSSLKHSRAAGILSNRFFGGGSRNEPPVLKEPVVDDEHYVLKVINLPLVEQTRLTRISKRLEDSRDKTEFWMPAFPWRAIDYLNYKGSDVEGLYRVPGSGPQIKKWQRKFDEELDVDLFDQTDLYDINIIGSMLKAWLRELPDELLPKEAQERIARDCAGAETVPQMLVNELSNLPPFNYYLLFAITCHLSLLLAHSEKNKMDFRNLCICFQPCMRIDVFCFKFLVCDWRHCWKGCKNEAKYIEEEYALFDQPPPKPAGGRKKSGCGIADEQKQDERTLSSSDSNKSPSRDADDQKGRLISSSDSNKSPSRDAGDQQGRLKQEAVEESESTETGSTISSTLTVNSERQTPPRTSGDLRPLSPIKPLSPLNF